MEQNKNKPQLSNDSKTTPELLTLRVPNSIKERRIDKYLHSRLRGLPRRARARPRQAKHEKERPPSPGNFSRVMIQDIIKAGSVKVNGKIVKPSFKLNPGDRIVLELPQLPSKDILPEDIPLNIIYEDDDIIILNKQADMLVHPARSNTHGTLVNALVFYSDRLSSGLGEFRPGIIHRLDKNTTGVMVVTKNDTAQWKIAKQFENRKTKKSYLAIVHGTPELTADRINVPLGVHPKAREKYAIRPLHQVQGKHAPVNTGVGKEAITFYEVLESFRGFSLLKLTPKTGRTHQIRVHLSYIKHPIVADNMYGGKLVYPWQLQNAEPAAQDPIINRTALHALTLEFKHPTTEKQVKFEAPLPQDMQNLLDMLRKFRKE